MKRFDFYVRNEGNIFLLFPITQKAKRWIEENLPSDRMCWSKATVVEHRYIYDIVNGIVADGMTVK